MTDGIETSSGVFASEVLSLTGRGVDVVLELVGGPYVAEDLRALAPRGRLVLVGLVGGMTAELNLGLVMSKRATIHGTMLRSRPLEEKIEAANGLARHLVPLFARGALRAIVDRTYPLAEAAAAHAYVASNAGFGKVVLRVAADS
jgi:NADPH2:quinone reductase